MEKNKRSLFLLGAGLAVLIAGAALLYGALPGGAANTLSAPAANDAGNGEAIPAPDFTVTASDGENIAFSQLTGRPMILNFWASWCGPCKSEMPDFQSVFDELGGDQVSFMMVNATDGQRETISSATAYIEDNGFTFPVYYDTGQEAVRAYGIRAFPTTVFIYADGTVAGAVEGALTEQSLKMGISMIVGEDIHQ